MVSDSVIMIWMRRSDKGLKCAVKLHCLNDQHRVFIRLDSARRNVLTRAGFQI